MLITAVAPFPDVAKPDAPLPAIRPLNAVLDEEKLELRLAWLEGSNRGPTRRLSAHGCRHRGDRSSARRGRPVAGAVALRHATSPRRGRRALSPNDRRFFPPFPWTQNSPLTNEEISRGNWTQREPSSSARVSVRVAPRSALPAHRSATDGVHALDPQHVRFQDELVYRTSGQSPAASTQWNSPGRL